MCKYTVTTLDCGHARERIQRGKACKTVCEDSARNTTTINGHGKCHRCNKKSTPGKSLKPADVPCITTKLASIQVSAPATPVTRKLPSSSQVPAQPAKSQPAAAGVSTKSVAFASAQPVKPQPAAGGGLPKTSGSMAPAKAPLAKAPMTKAPAKATAGASSSQTR